jgi:hypothetical protein
VILNTPLYLLKEPSWKKELERAEDNEKHEDND